MSLAQLKKLSRREVADDALLERVRKDPEPVAIMPPAHRPEPRVRYEVLPWGVGACPIPSFIHRGEPQPEWPPVVRSPEAAYAKAAAEAEWKRRFGGGAA